MHGFIFGTLKYQHDRKKPGDPNAFSPSKRGWINFAELDCRHPEHHVNCGGASASGSTTNCPVDRTDCRGDDFDDDAPNESFWSTEGEGTGPEAAEDDHSLQITLPADSVASEATGQALGQYASLCALRGDFDIRVDFDLSTWPDSSGVRLALRAGDITVERVSFAANEFLTDPREVYLTNFRSSDGIMGLVGTADTAGRLRLVRSGTAMTGYRFDAGNWLPVHTADAGSADLPFAIQTWANSNFSGDETVVTFDNFVIAQGTLACGGTSTSTTSTTSTSTTTSTTTLPPEGWVCCTGSSLFTAIFPNTCGAESYGQIAAEIATCEMPFGMPTGGVATVGRCADPLCGPIAGCCPGITDVVGFFGDAASVASTCATFGFGAYSPDRCP